MSRVETLLSLDAAEDLTHTGRLALLYLADVQEARINDFVEGAKLPLATANRAADQLVEAGLATERREEIDGPGPERRVLTLSIDVGTAIKEADGEIGGREAIRGHIVRALAQAHYLESLSSLPGKQVAKRIGVDEGQAISTPLSQLSEEGVVEKVPKGGQPRWRLVGADAVAPYYAPGTAEAGGSAND